MEAISSALRPVLKPVTHNLPAPIRDFGVSLLGVECYNALVLDVNFADTECLKLGISKALGIGIVTASSIVKVPQILNLVRSRSASGVSFLSYLLETSSYLISLAYNVRNGFPFSTYGETAMILVQNVVITALVLNYSGKAGVAAAFVAALVSGSATLLTNNMVDMKTLGFLQAGAGALGVASKIPQILAIWQEGGTGQLSAFTVFNFLLGSLVRIYTTFQEVDDKLILYSFVAGFILNLVLAAQMVYYWNAPATKASGKQRKPIAVASEPSSGTSSALHKPSTPSTRRKA